MSATKGVSKRSDATAEAPWGYKKDGTPRKPPGQAARKAAGLEVKTPTRKKSEPDPGGEWVEAGIGKDTPPKTGPAPAIGIPAAAPLASIAPQLEQLIALIGLAVDALGEPERAAVFRKHQKNLSKTYGAVIDADPKLRAFFEGKKGGALVYIPAGLATAAFLMDLNRAGAEKKRRTQPTPPAPMEGSGFGVPDIAEDAGDLPMIESSPIRPAAVSM